jgi:hypothetical protein
LKVQVSCNWPRVMYNLLIDKNNIKVCVNYIILYMKLCTDKIVRVKYHGYDLQNNN